ncbi:MAG TPA: uroporphyrinogen-III synthase [Acidimicrobiales bacterium]|nr:uroporphyrinogen-III synthase [Acidimicrobiales bacterium]
MALQPLEGYVVGITADRRWSEQAELLKRRGAEILHGPTISTLYLADDDALRAATLSLIESPPDYLVATTGIGIRAWLEAVDTWGLGPQLTTALSKALVVARGPKAAAAVQSAGFDVWQRSPTERLPEILDLLKAERLAGRRVAIQEYGMESPELSAALSDEGAEVIGVPVYRWRLPEDDGPARRLVEAACSGRLDAVTFTSAPAVHNLFVIAGRIDLAEDLRDALNASVVAGCVGPVCGGAAREEGVDTPLQPDVGRLGLLVRALSDHVRQRRRTLSLAGVSVVVQGSALLLDDHAVELSPLERSVFDQLAERPGVVVSRASLLRNGWGSASTNAQVLEATMARLRRRLGPAAPALQSVAGRGYRLACEPGPSLAPAGTGEPAGRSGPD